MKIVCLLYNHMTALDLIGPHEILFRLPNVELYRVAKQVGLIHTESACLQLLAEYRTDDIHEADILLVPGAGNATSLKDDEQTLAWIRKIHETTTWTTSVCTGSLILAASGILVGRCATSHWAAIDRLSNFDAIPISKRIVEDGKIITAAGVSAGIDMALTLAEKISGRQVAETLQLGIEYDPEPPFNSGSVNKANPQLVSGLRKRLHDKFEK